MNNHFSNCLLCNSNQLIKLNRYKNAFLVKCRKCDFVLSSKIPSEAELKEHYKNYAPNSVLSEITEKRYHELLDQLEPFRQTNNILDIGCGEGYFLEVAKKRNWNVYGTEYRDEIISKCEHKEIKMHSGKLSSHNYEKVSFDVITSFEVIEHINNPTEEINTINKLLRKGGALYMTTPNFNSLSRLLLGSKWNVIEYPEHLSYYTSSTLNKLAINQGFTKKYCFTSGISLARINNSIGASKVNTNDELLREKTEKKTIYMMAKKIINLFLKLSNWGDSLKGLFVKR